MNPIEFKGQTLVMGRPHGWDETVSGKCVGLPVRCTPCDDGNVEYKSYWKPSRGELLALTNDPDCYIMLTCIGGQVPVSLRLGLAEEIKEIQL